jgi:hypothetical protein
MMNDNDRKHAEPTLEAPVRCPSADTATERELRPEGEDHGLLVRFVGIDVLLASSVAGAAVLGHTWLIAPLMGLLLISLGLVSTLFTRLLRDPIA